MIVDPTKTYKVKLSRIVRDGPFTYKPLHEIEMSGELLARLVDQEGEDIIDAAVVAE